jgi:hypothetical protein
MGCAWGIRENMLFYCIHASLWILISFIMCVSYTYFVKNYASSFMNEVNISELDSLAHVMSNSYVRVHRLATRLVAIL